MGAAVLATARIHDCDDYEGGTISNWMSLFVRTIRIVWLPI
jgi:hypothetical protein